MLTELNNSIKAKLYDFTYTPFMSSFVISWIMLNHKYLLIYFAEADLDKKLTQLNNYDFSCSVFGIFNLPYSMNFWFPLIFGLFYVFIYPWFSKRFYEYTLNQLKDLKKIKQDIHDKTPMLQEEANLLYSELERLSKQRDEAVSKVATMEDKYKPEIQNIDLRRFEKYLNNNEKEEDPRTKVLRYLYISKNSSELEDNLFQNIMKETKLARPKVNQIYKELISENILRKDGNFIFITDVGNDKLLAMFDNEDG